ncbi:MAG: sel1 repeat family protein [Burkholderiales bacterium]|nr:sel1 repeat family protein [Burkholderiales bacterium]
MHTRDPGSCPPQTPASLATPPIDPLKHGLALFHAAEPDFKRAAGWFHAAAGGGDRDGMAMLGLCYLEGLGLASDPVQARELLERAASRGSVIGRFQLGRVLVTGRGGPADEARGFSAYVAAAAMGHAEASFNLANCLHAGVGCLPDRLAAKALYLRSRKLGCALSPNGVRVRRHELKAVRTLAQRFADPNRLIFLMRERQQQLTLMQALTQPALPRVRHGRVAETPMQRRWRRAGRLAVGVMAAMAGTLGQYLRPRRRDAGPTTLNF